MIHKYKFRLNLVLKFLTEKHENTRINCTWYRHSLSTTLKNFRILFKNSLQKLIMGIVQVKLIFFKKPHERHFTRSISIRFLTRSNHGVRKFFGIETWNQKKYKKNSGIKTELGIKISPPRSSTMFWVGDLDFPAPILDYALRLSYLI